MKLIVKRESSELSALRKASNYLSIGRTLSLLSRSIFIENSRGAIHNNHREKDADTGTLSIVFFSLPLLASGSSCAIYRD